MASSARLERAHRSALRPGGRGHWLFIGEPSDQTGFVQLPDPKRDDDIVLHRVRAICGGFAGADEGELQDRPLFRVGRRRFAIFNGETSPARSRWSQSGRSLHFVAESLEFEALRRDGRFTPSPHHGDRGWLALRLDDPDVADWVEIAELLESAYRRIAPRALLEQ